MNTALTQPEHTMVTPTCSLNLGGRMTDDYRLSILGILFLLFEFGSYNL